MANSLKLLVGAAVLACAATVPARAAYPDKPVRILVGFPPGSTADLMARIIGSKLGDGLRQPVIVENRTGAGSSIAAEAVARSAADGYTLLLSTTANVINQSVSPNLKFDFMRDLTPRDAHWRKPGRAGRRGGHGAAFGGGAGYARQGRARQDDLRLLR
jgi:tripartite-type tricarboxylate transporter receptor subunit TctC